MTTQAMLWIAAGAALALAVLAVMAERRRTGRHNLDSVGWVPWTAIQIVGFFAAVILAVLAVKA